MQVEQGVQEVLQIDQQDGPSVSIAICSLDFIDINATRIALQNTCDPCITCLAARNGHRIEHSPGPIR